MGVTVIVDVDGAGIDIEVGLVVCVGITLAIGAQEAKIKIKMIRKTVTMFLIFIHTFLRKGMPNGLRYLRWDGDGEAVQPEKC